MKLIFIGLWICLTTTLYAEAPPPATGLDLQSITINHELLLFFQLKYQDKEYGMAWGLDPLVADQLKTVPSAKPYVEGYQMTNLISNMAFWGGLYSMAWGFTSALDLSFSHPSEPGAQAVASEGVGMLVAGFCSVVLSVPFTLTAGSELRTGVADYTRDRTLLPLPHSEQGAQ